MLISLEEAKKHLRVEHNADDDLINSLILSAQNWADSFLNFKIEEVEDPPEIFKQAMLLVIGSWYENRENVSDKYVPYVACSLLWPFRKVPV